MNNLVPYNQRIDDDASFLIEMNFTYVNGKSYTK